MPDAVTVFIATVIANIVSSLILDLLHTALQKWHQGQISFLKIKNPGGTNSWVFFCDEKISSQLQFSQFKRVLAKSNL